MAAPIVAAAMSPLLQWRDEIYIAAGLAGVLALALMLLQPLLIGGRLPGLSIHRSRRLHRWVGGMLVVCVVLHVAGLWLTSPPDVIDALLFRAPTAFSAWGVIAMWALFAAAALAALRKRLGVRPRVWRMGHTLLALAIVAGTVVHALLIEGAMETVTKVGLSVLVLLATAKIVLERRVWRRLARARQA